MLLRVMKFSVANAVRKPQAAWTWSKAKRVVGVGRGLAAQDDLKMVHELAAVLECWEPAVHVHRRRRELDGA